MIESVIKKLVGSASLEAGEVAACANEMMSGEATPVQIAAFLTALHMRGETVDDLAAFASVMRDKAAPFSREPGVVLDTCGTGGDSSGTFNISTAAAFVAAGAGVRVAKHGNRSMSSKCGSADVLAELGVNIESDSHVMEEALESAGICFLFAQRYHQSMKHVAPVRRELGFRTVFNMLGPLSNPARASHQLIGVFGREPVDMLAQVLARLGVNRAMVVHGEDGLDEISTCAATVVAEVKDGTVSSGRISAEEFGMASATREELLGGDAAANAKIISDILNGSPGPPADIVLLNAGAAIYVAENAPTIKQGIEAARQSISSGAAREKLEKLKEITSKHHA